MRAFMSCPWHAVGARVPPHPTEERVMPSSRSTRRPLFTAVTALALALATAALGPTGTPGAAGALGPSGAAGPAGTAALQPAAEAAAVTFSDDFDGAAGLPADGSRWQIETGDNVNNHERQYYTAGNRNAALDGQGHLVG